MLFKCTAFSLELSARETSSACLWQELAVHSSDWPEPGCHAAPSLSRAFFFSLRLILLKKNSETRIIYSFQSKSILEGVYGKKLKEHHT